MGAGRGAAEENPSDHPGQDLGPGLCPPPAAPILRVGPPLGGTWTLEPGTGSGVRGRWDTPARPPHLRSARHVLRPFPWAPFVSLWAGGVSQKPHEEGEAAPTLGRGGSSVEGPATPVGTGRSPRAPRAGQDRLRSLPTFGLPGRGPLPSCHTLSPRCRAASRLPPTAPTSGKPLPDQAQEGGAGDGQRRGPAPAQARCPDSVGGPRIGTLSHREASARDTDRPGRQPGVLPEAPTWPGPLGSPRSGEGQAP